MNRLFLARRFAQCTVLSSLVFFACACEFARSFPPTASVPDANALQAARVAVQYAQAGVPYLRLDGEPTDVRGQCVQAAPTVCSVYIVGRIVNTIPAGGNGSPPERTELLPLLQVQVNGTSFEAMGVRGFAAADTPDITHMPQIAYQQ